MQGGYGGQQPRGYGGQQPQVVGMQLGAPQMDAMTA